MAFLQHLLRVIIHHLFEIILKALLGSADFDQPYRVRVKLRINLLHNRVFTRSECLSTGDCASTERVRAKSNGIHFMRRIIATVR